MKVKIITIIILIILVVYVTILAINVTNNEEANFKIVTSFYPIYIATLNLTYGIDDVMVTNLTKQTTGCIHDYVLTTSELISLDNADVLIINGAGMEGFMNKVISNFKTLPVIDASYNIETITEECKEVENIHDHEHHSHETNPHIFVNIKNYIMQVENICDKLIQLDSKNKDKYEANKARYINELEILDKQTTNTITSLENKNIITFHNTFDYYARQYGLNVLGVIEKEHGQLPNAKQIAILVETIKDSNIKAIFVEPEYNKKIVETISKESGAKVYILNPVTSGKNNKDEYINIMKQNLLTLKTALS